MNLKPLNLVEVKHPILYRHWPGMDSNHIQREVELDERVRITTLLSGLSISLPDDLHLTQS